MIHNQSPEGFRSKQLNDWVWNHVPNPVYSRTGVGVNVSQIIADVKDQFTTEDRIVLHDVLIAQYEDIQLTIKEKENLDKLKNGALVVSTGQQLHPFLGPVFVWNKIFTAIESALFVEKNYGESVVPIFWMASEDHDFDEVKHIPFLGRNYEWKNNQKGAVGRMQVDGIVDVCEQILTDFKTDNVIQQYFSTFTEIYASSKTMAQATRKVLHYLMGETGIIAIDPDSEKLKTLAIDLWSAELTDKNFQSIQNQNKALEENNIPVVVNPRRTQLFKLTNNDRQRIDHIGDDYKLKDGELISKSELQALIIDNPECVSPNVLLRPLYQQRILPNIAYVAGPSEYYYWLQLPKEFFQNNITMPWLVMRSGSLFLPNSAKKKIQKMNLSIEDLFKSNDALSKLILEKIEGEYTLDSEINNLQSEFESIWTSLFKSKTDGLKEIKKKHQSILKELRQLSSLIKSGDALNEEKQLLVSGVLKVKEEFFNSKAPQERIQFYIEWLVKGANFPMPNDTLTAFVEL